MTYLVIGLALWVIAHLFKRWAPGARAAMGENAAKMAVAVALVAAIVLMVIGYRAAEVQPLYSPLPGIGYLNNLLMVVSVFLFGVGGTKGTLYTRLRHPMLTGTALWAIAHLLVNGDVASLVLFGGIGLWAVVSMLVINASGPWARPTGGRGVKGDLMNLAGTVVLFGIIAYVHIWLGYSPFMGTYG